MFIKLRKPQLVGRVNHPEGAHIEICDVRGKALVKQGVARRTLEPPPTAEVEDDAESEAPEGPDFEGDDLAEDGTEDEDEDAPAIPPSPEPSTPTKGRRTRKES